jgi:hypothetical protein
MSGTQSENHHKVCLIFNGLLIPSARPDLGSDHLDLHIHRFATFRVTYATEPDGIRIEPVNMSHGDSQHQISLLGQRNNDPVLGKINGRQGIPSQRTLLNKENQRLLVSSSQNCRAESHTIQDGQQQMESSARRRLDAVAHIGRPV